MKSVCQQMRCTLESDNLYEAREPQGASRQVTRKYDAEQGGAHRPQTWGAVCRRQATIRHPKPPPTPSYTPMHTLTLA
jgi:hypothetical protein